jgi:hypothetical protein
LRKRLDEWTRAWTIFSTFVSSTRWYLGMQGQLPEYLCPRECAGQLDFVSFDYYFGISAPTPAQLNRLARSVQRQFNRTAVWATLSFRVLPLPLSAPADHHRKNGSPMNRRANNG